MSRILLCIEEPNIINILERYDADTYVFTSEKNILDDITSMLKKDGWSPKISAIFYHRVYSAEYYKDDKTIIYYFNATFPNDYFALMKTFQFSTVISHSDNYLQYFSDNAFMKT